MNDDVYACITDVRDFLSAIEDEDCTEEVFEGIQTCVETLQQAIDSPIFDPESFDGA